MNKGLVHIKDIESRIGTVIPSISGRITSIFPPKEGKGVHGDWKLQNISMEQDGFKCQVTLSSCETMPEDMKGTEIYFESVGTKFGLKGVSVEKREFKDKSGNDKTTIGLKVTKTAVCKVGGEATHPIVEKLHEAVNGGKSQQNSTQTNVGSKNGISLDDKIVQYRKLYGICARNADTVIKEYDFSEEDYREITTTFFIQAVRDGLHNQLESQPVKKVKEGVQDSPEHELQESIEEPF